MGREVERVLHYDGKQQIPETLQTELLGRNHDDPRAGNFGVKKTLELLPRKYYWPKMRADVYLGLQTRMQLYYVT